ncbi:Wzz/FepE/Etk N-terminal domain-containing protein [Maritalea sp.]|uniref:Wzz/FepE/Etk N-terminal domain-containing protein n=1 Tax=Maritalea sp. TaxID=2003361 RepID=UPI003EF38DA3
MSPTQPHQDDEIDLLELFGTLWKGKWIIILISIATVIAGGVLTYLQPNSYRATLPLSIGSPTAFTKYTSLNELLHQNKFEYQITRETVFENFVSEFNSHDSVLFALAQSETVAQAAKEFGGVQKSNYINKLAKNFEIVIPNGTNTNRQMKFDWVTAEEGRKILEVAAVQSLSNVKADIELDLAALIQTLVDRNRFEKEAISNSLALMKQTILLENEQRILFLKEQTAIAKELDIVNNSLGANNLAQTQANGIALSVSSSEVPFYLRGYKAIDKEISLLQNRTDAQNLSLNFQYMQLKTQFFALQNDISASQLLESVAVLTTDDPRHWVTFDVDFAEIRSSKRTLIYLALSLLIGGFIGLVVVLIRSAIVKRNQRTI